MMQGQRDVWAEVLSVDWPIRGLRTRSSLVPPPAVGGDASAAAILDASAEVVRKALPVDVRVVIELTGPGGGTWTLDRTAEGPRIVRGDAPWCDSRLRCPVARFSQILRSDTDPMALLARGEVQIEGDIGLLLRLRTAWRDTASLSVG